MATKQILDTKYWCGSECRHFRFRIGKGYSCSKGYDVSDGHCLLFKPSLSYRINRKLSDIAADINKKRKD